MSEEPVLEAELTVRDRLNLPYLLANQILTYQRVIPNFSYSLPEIQEAIGGLVAMIPKSWHDEQWSDDLEKSITTIKTDLRPRWCGKPISIEATEKLGITPFKETKIYDYKKLFHACINLLDRRGLLSRREYVEEMTGERFDNAIVEET